MAAKPSAKKPGRATVRKSKSRASLSAAMLRAASVHGLSQEGLARDVGVNKRTIRRWSRGKFKMDVEAVADAPIVGETFRRLWCSEDHDVVPFVARKSKRSGG